MQIQDAIHDLDETLAPIMDRLQEVLETTNSKQEAQDVEAQLDELQETTDELKERLLDIIATSNLPTRRDDDDREEDDNNEYQGRAKPDLSLIHI